jgi:hypothetical protein
MRPKLQKHSVLKLAGRIIPRSAGFNTPQLAAESVPKLALEFIPMIILARIYINVNAPDVAMYSVISKKINLR